MNQKNPFCAHLRSRLLLLVSLLTWCGVSIASTQLPGPVVSVKWLHEHVHAVQIVDIRDDPNTQGNDPKYARSNGHKYLVKVGGHIPDALSVNFWALRAKHKVNGKTFDFQFPTAKEFEEIMRASQLENGKPIVLVPTGDNAVSLQEASMLALELVVYGVPAKQIAILNGGTHAWIAAGYDTYVDLILPMESSKWTAKPSHMNLIVNTKQVAAAQKKGAVLLDARPIAQFVGVSRSPAVPQPGRIKDAVSLPPDALYYKANDGSWHFMQAKSYAAAIKALRLKAGAPSITYCNTGQYAAGAWFILDRIMGEKNVREYPGSMYTWEHLHRPIAHL